MPELKKLTSASCMFRMLVFFLSIRIWTIRNIADTGGERIRPPTRAHWNICFINSNSEGPLQEIMSRIKSDFWSIHEFEIEEFLKFSISLSRKQCQFCSSVWQENLGITPVQLLIVSRFYGGLISDWRQKVKTKRVLSYFVLTRVFVW